MDETTELPRPLQLHVLVPKDDSYWNYPDYTDFSKTDYVVDKVPDVEYDCIYCRLPIWFDSSESDDNFEPPAPGFWRTRTDDDGACSSDSRRPGDGHYPYTGLARREAS